MEKKTLIKDGVKSIAVLEASKGILVLLAGFGLLSLLHRDVEEIAEHLVRMSHLNPARHYPRIFIEAATHTDDKRLISLAAIAFLYSTIRFVEAYGLWRTRVWAEWFAIISGSVYLPLEFWEFIKKPTWLRAAVFIINTLIVAYLAYVRWNNHKEKVATAEKSPIGRREASTESVSAAPQDAP